MPATPLTPEQTADASRLKTIFATWQRARRDAGIPSSQEAISELLGFNQSALSQYLNGKIPLNVSAAVKFAALIGCSVSDFSPELGGLVGKYSTAAEPSDAALLPRQLSPVSVDPVEDTVPVKLVNIRVQAGMPGFDADREFEDGGVVHVPKDLVESQQWVLGCLLATKVRGDSMYPMMADGDIIVINIADTKMVSGEVYAVNCEGKPVVKQMAYEGHQWYMRSFNPKHKPVPFRTPESGIVGKVVYQPGRVIAGRSAL
jgi:phage repressor protein C with HTH and peptisase S24 domain